MHRCINQVNRRPLADHDPLTQDIWSRLKDDLRIRASGGEVTAALAKEVQLISDAGLDESAGEGWHRSCNHEKTRARNSSLVHLKRTVRQKAIVANLKRFLKTYGDRATSVLRYEWTHWKRVLQTRHRYRWQPKLVKASEAIACIYREDKKSREDWTSVVLRMPDVRPVTTDSASEREKLERDWLVATLEPNQIYSISHTKVQTRDDGIEECVPHTSYFHLINFVHAHCRPHLVHSVFSADSIALTAGIALSVRFLDEWGSGVAETSGARLVHPEGDAEWVAPDRVAPFQSWLDTLSTFRICLQTMLSKDVFKLRIW